jgi:hypothetical protein
VLLLEDSISIGTLSLYRDHASLSTFHYLPGPPQTVAENGVPRCQLLRFRGTGQSGGFLSLQVQLERDPATLQAAHDQLASRFGVDPNLVPVLFDQGTTRLSVLDFHAAGNATSGAAGSASAPVAAGAFVEGVLGSTVPSLLGQQQAIFSVKLTPEGSTLLEGALRGGSTPVLVIYDLQFTGLSPALGIRARAHYQMSYDYLRTRFQANTLYFKTDLDREAEQLVRQGGIEIEDVDYQGVDAAVRTQRDAEVRATVNRLMQGLFFRPAPSPATAGIYAGGAPPGADAYWASQGRPQLAFVMRNLEQHEEDLITYDLTESHVDTSRISPQGALRLPGGIDISKLMLDITTDWPPPITQVRAFTPPGADWLDVTALEVNLRQGNDLRTLVLTPTQHDLTANFSQGPIEYNLRVLARQDSDSLGMPPVADPTFRSLTTDNLVLDPAALSGQRVLRVALGAIDFTTIRSVAGKLELKDQQRNFQLDSNHRELVVNVWGNEAVHLHASLMFSDGSSVTVERAITPQDKVVLINQPADRFHVVEVILQDPLQRFQSVVVSIEAAAGASRQSCALDSGKPVAHWSAPRDPASPGGFRYQARKILRDASVADDDWKQAVGSLLVVGDPEIRIETIQGILVGGQNSQGGLIRLAPASPPPGMDGVQEIMLDAGQTMFTARLPFDLHSPRKYRISGEVFLDAGPVDLLPHEDTSEIVLVTVPPTHP